MNADGEPQGGPQVWYGDSPSISLGHVNAGSETAPPTQKIRIYTPDSRIRVKVSFLFVPDTPADSANPVTSWGATLYIGEEEQDRAFGRTILCTDVLRDSTGTVVHQSAPLAIPEDPGLSGFTQEFVSAADSLLCIFSPGNLGGSVSGFWTVQVRYQPDGQRLCNEDWDWVKRKCHATLLGPQFSL